jgi:uncharacterized pyridoxamine 5'-phosphate oxidase family protein
MNKESLIEEVWSHFGERHLIFLATSEDNQPKVRPVMVINFDGGFYVSVKAEKSIVKQIENNPKAAFCLEIGNIMKEYAGVGYVRVECIAEILDDLELKTRLFNEVDIISRYYEDLDDYLTRGRSIKLTPTVIRYMAPDSWKPKKIKL